jgi:hypothetical protein
MIKALVVVSVVSLIHSWYPRDCCSDKDCGPIPSNRVQVTPDGYVVDGRWRVAFSAAKTSPDEEYHLCAAPSGLRCFFVPKGSV